ncbi:MAG: DUF1552 domain-containing protein [Gammaproteobacteria bacterium]
MFLTKKYLPRRTVLRGLGASIALPLLEAMIPAATAIAQTAAAAKPRVGFIYFPHGAVMSKWTPTKVGADFDLPPILQPLRDFQHYLTVVSELENFPAIAEPVHAVTPGTWLSCVHPRISQDPWGGVTIDQMMAKLISQDTPMPSLEVATEEEGGEGACDRNYGCSFGKTISFSTPNTPLPMEHNPRKLFQRLFGQGDTPAERVILTRENTSMLDMVTREAAALRKTLGARDQSALDGYLESVREIERRTQKLQSGKSDSLALPPTPAGIPDRFDEHIRLMFDIIHLAWRANLTRVTSFMMAAEVSNQPYSFIGIPDAFHPLSHHQNNPQKLDRLAKLQAYNTQLFAEFVKKLSETQDGENNMLQNSMLLFGSNMSDSNLHNHYPLPTVLVGGAAGQLKGNQHIKYPEKTRLANLHLTLMEKAGIDMDKVGDSSGRLSEV